MKKERKTEIKVGLTVIIATALLLWVIGWAKNFSPASSDYDLKVMFGNVAGLEVGDYVTVNGVRSGYVERIDVIRDSVLVLMKIEEETNIYRDARFNIAMLDLMGGKRVNIYPGNSGESINSEVIHTGSFNADIPEVMNTMGALSRDLPEVMEKIHTTLDGINEYLHDEEMKENLSVSLENLVSVSSQLNSMLYRNREHFDSLAVNGALLTSELRTFIDSNNNKLEKSFENADSLLTNANKLFIKIDDLIEETRNQENNAGKFLYDESLMSEMKESIKNLNEAFGIILDQLKNEGVNVRANISF